jgi:hypothetical protein
VVFAFAHIDADEHELATLSCVHWFNENRLHSSIGYLIPLEKENQYYRENNPQSQPAMGEGRAPNQGRFVMNRSGFYAAVLLAAQPGNEQIRLVRLADDGLV